MSTSQKTVALLLSGGAGTRLWPVSRPESPKQFLKLFGALSLYQLTLKRLRASGVDAVIVAANRDHEALLAEQAAAIGETPPLLMLEPARRDSGPAIAAGVALAKTRFGEDAVVCAMPCDHLIPDTAAFSETLEAAVALARAGYLATFGITPTMPSTEFGYLQQGKAITSHPAAYKVERFHEKPRLDLAVRYLAEGGFSWNSGMFVFAAGVFAEEAAAHMPDVWTAAQAAVTGATVTGHTVNLSEAAFLAAPKISIDYALFEKSGKVAMVPARFGWSDVGNWAAVFASLDKDKGGNATIGDVRTRDVANALIIAENTSVVAIGVENLTIIARPDGVFIATRSRAAEVKDLVGG
jgi:mannose-1-phosphate guanylyltransferase/mannose-6-phosphate isomerase